VYEIHYTRLLKAEERCFETVVFVYQIMQCHLPEHANVLKRTWNKLDYFIICLSKRT